MKSYILEAACTCQTGKFRDCNEDNFFFDGRCLEEKNKGLRHPVSMTVRLRREVCLAVFDGIGGADFGETAAFVAAQGMHAAMDRLDSFFVPERHFLQQMTRQLNDLVSAKRQEMHTDHMGTTMAALLFSQNYVYVCNLGDSRAYRLRSGEFMQLSRDHAERPDGEKKGLLTQFVGMDERAPEPYIAKGEIRSGDWYLICSDGLTDTLTNLEIDFILLRSSDPVDCARELTEAALKAGARDNVTAIVIRIADAQPSDEPDADSIGR